MAKTPVHNLQSNAVYNIEQTNKQTDPGQNIPKFFAEGDRDYHWISAASYIRVCSVCSERERQVERGLDFTSSTATH